LSSESPSSSHSDSPYVSLPNPSDVIKLQESTLDSTSDDSEVFDHQNPNNSDLSSSTPNSMDSLELFKPVQYSGIIPWDSADSPYSRESSPFEWSPSGFTKKPLLECYSPPPVVDDKAYITMNEALESSNWPRDRNTLEASRNSVKERNLFSSKVRANIVNCF